MSQRPSKAKGRHSFLRFNHQNPELKTLFWHIFFKELSNAYKTQKPGLTTLFDVSDEINNNKNNRQLVLQQMISKQCHQINDTKNSTASKVTKINEQITI